MEGVENGEVENWEIEKSEIECFLLTFSTLQLLDSHLLFI